MGVRGDFAAAHELVASFHQLASAEARRQANKQLAEEARTQIVLGFEQKRDPYGRPWKATLRGGQTLRDTAHLLNSLAPRVTSNGFTVSTPLKYAPVHQYGATIRPRRATALRFRIGNQWVTKKEVTIPRRQYMPEGDLGAIWTRAFEKVLELTVQRVVRHG